MRIWETKASEMRETEKLDVIINSFKGKWYRKEERRKISVSAFEGWGA